MTSTPFNEGDRVVIDEPVYCAPSGDGIDGIPRYRHPSGYAGRTATVVSGPDHQGDYSLYVDGDEPGEDTYVHHRGLRKAEGASSIDALTLQAVALRAAYWVALGDANRAAQAPSAASLDAWRVVAEVTR